VLSGRAGPEGYAELIAGKPEGYTYLERWREAHGWKHPDNQAGHARTDFAEITADEAPDGMLGSVYAIREAQSQVFTGEPWRFRGLERELSPEEIRTAEKHVAAARRVIDRRVRDSQRVAKLIVEDNQRRGSAQEFVRGYYEHGQMETSGFAEPGRILDAAFTRFEREAIVQLDDNTARNLGNRVSDELVHKRLDDLRPVLDRMRHIEGIDKNVADGSMVDLLHEDAKLVEDLRLKWQAAKDETAARYQQHDDLPKHTDTAGYVHVIQDSPELKTWNMDMERLNRADEEAADIWQRNRQAFGIKLEYTRQQVEAYGRELVGAWTPVQREKANTLSKAIDLKKQNAKVELEKWRSGVESGMLLTNPEGDRPNTILRKSVERFKLTVGASMLDAVERDADFLGWSTPADRRARAGLKFKSGDLTYGPDGEIMQVVRHAQRTFGLTETKVPEDIFHEEGFSRVPLTDAERAQWGKWNTDRRTGEQLIPQDFPDDPATWTKEQRRLVADKTETARIPDERGAAKGARLYVIPREDWRLLKEKIKEYGVPFFGIAVASSVWAERANAQVEGGEKPTNDPISTGVKWFTAAALLGGAAALARKRLAPILRRALKSGAERVQEKVDMAEALDDYAGKFSVIGSGMRDGELHSREERRRALAQQENPAGDPAGDGEADRPRRCADQGTPCGPRRRRHGRQAAGPARHREQRPEPDQPSLRRTRAPERACGPDRVRDGAAGARVAHDRRVAGARHRGDDGVHAALVTGGA